MRSFEETRVIASSAGRMFDVVMDIEAYPQYLPWVADATILTEQQGELTAELVADLAGSRHSFKTIDRYVSEKLIEIRLLDGPFRFLESIWTFEAMGDDRCKVHFSIEFEFRSMMLDMVASPIFATACKSMVQAFEQRALALKGL
ncbi:type II toxin-antitoxin system RatA family toxin [Mariprofundus sp. NF]|uniref:type II toxin-antitoxin system RatA family toxin n=1 Tax=Mariprofundus sp. NF TaxID=2608716 RepID=UPI0015A46862|nr:type II toxin-antitoxin system RatA family toxin [Mariprofundus sp. NF]NWF39549.1 type II toxin-antitoxin system RatA family toxin [Mariprofundus sp. NF]